MKNTAMMAQLLGKPVFSGWTKVVPSWAVVPMISRMPAALPARMGSMGRTGSRSSWMGPDQFGDWLALDAAPGSYKGATTVWEHWDGRRAGNAGLGPICSGA